MDTDDFKINLNQNVWGLLLSLTTLGVSEYFNFKCLFWFGLILSVLTTISFTSTLTAYTINYCRKKIKNDKYT